jgi:hypothetical protein
MKCEVVLLMLTKNFIGPYEGQLNPPCFSNSSFKIIQQSTSASPNVLFF